MSDDLSSKSVMVVDDGQFVDVEVRPDGTVSVQADRLPVAGFLTTGPSKASIIQALALAFERGAIRIPADPVLLGELQAFEGKTSPSGVMRYGAPAGLHDDTVMALAIGWAALVGPREQRSYLTQQGTISAAPQPYTISPI